MDQAEQELQAGLACVPNDIDAAVAHLAAAIRLFTDCGEPRRAAIACARLGDLFANLMGNRTAARAWFARADRLVADLPACIEQGWVAVAPLGCEVDDPDALLARAELALERAREFGDTDLEIKALADGGLAHVQAGRLSEGMALLDEAMALVCGLTSSTPEQQRVTGQSVCSFYTACYHSADFDRAAAWTEPLRQLGVIATTGGPQVYLSSHCDTVHAALLCELGRWTEAETVLEKAIREFESVLGVPSWHPAIGLADLRVRQGRLAEAEQLLLGKDGSMQALLPAARLHLARGEYELARAAARRGLRGAGKDALRAVDLLVVAAEAALALDDADAAVECIRELEARTATIDLPIVRARASATRSRVLAATGRLANAIGELEASVDALEDANVPWLRGTLLLELARLHERDGDVAAAVVEAKAASAILGPLDVVLTSGDDDALRRLLAASGADVAPSVATLGRDGKWWEAAFGSTKVRLPDTKGMRYVAALLARPGVERHAFDLVDAVEGLGDVDRRALGDAGEVADSRARADYRRRVEELRSEIEDAFEAGHEERALRLQSELDVLVLQLAQAFGLGGGPRVSSSAAEKARLNVTRALRAATAKLAEALPEAGAALDGTVRTGLFCAYEPTDGDIRWIVQS